MGPTNGSAPVGRGADAAGDERLKDAAGADPFLSPAKRLHQALHRVADGAMDADVALELGDGEALNKAVAGLTRNVYRVVVLAAEVAT